MPKGSKIIVKVKDLSPGSHIKVEVKCDYCDCIKIISYKDYLQHHDEKLGDCCHSCSGIKFKNTMNKKYGTTSSYDIPGISEKIKETNLTKYGKEFHMQRPEYQKWLEEYMLENYGAKRPLQNEELLEKANISKKKNNKTKTSKPQLKLSKILEKEYGNCEIEVPCGRCLLDCVIEVEGIKIDIEYDGLYWHKDIQRDRRRNFFVLSQGYKILRIKSNSKDDIPSIQEIQEKVNWLIKNNNNFAYIIIK